MPSGLSTFATTWPICIGMHCHAMVPPALGRLEPEACSPCGLTRAELTGAVTSIFLDAQSLAMPPTLREAFGFSTVTLFW